MVHRVALKKPRPDSCLSVSDGVPEQVQGKIRTPGKVMLEQPTRIDTRARILEVAEAAVPAKGLRRDFDRFPGRQRETALRHDAELRQSIVSTLHDDRVKRSLCIGPRPLDDLPRDSCNAGQAMRMRGLLRPRPAGIACDQFPFALRIYLVLRQIDDNAPLSTRLVSGCADRSRRNLAVARQVVLASIDCS